MSAYCVAFSYRPVTEVGSRDKFQQFTFILIMVIKLIKREVLHGKHLE